MIAVVLATSSQAAPALAAGPQVVVLGNLPGGCCSQAFAVNDQGVVVGQSMVGTGENPPERPFRWQNGVLTDLGTLGGPRAVATAINNNGWIVGYSELAGGGGLAHAFLWRPGHGMTDLGSLGETSIATGINDSGVVVGRYVADGQLHGFRWANGVMAKIVTPTGEGFDPVGVNGNGKIGGSLTAEYSGDPAWWKNGQTVASGLSGHASAINDNGDVTGTYWDGTQGAFVWRADGTVLHLTMPAGARFAATNGINESRHTVGTRTTASGNVRAVYWSEFGTPRLLPGLVPGGQSTAYGMNRRGQTVGQANLTATGGDYVAVLWTS
ncbi:hypothetical protein [Catellatospora methionotrophica]|uniref:hypothetical protein n=1 Tax=Catellatospora methionotrophica TaxID=121620 RepID=UPI001409DDC1|nr:hypothetical protein [Catellatospora methionotrophica]